MSAWLFLKVIWMSVDIVTLFLSHFPGCLVVSVLCSLSIIRTITLNSSHVTLRLHLLKLMAAVLFWYFVWAPFSSFFACFVICSWIWTHLSQLSASCREDLSNSPGPPSLFWSLAPPGVFLWNCRFNLPFSSTHQRFLDLTLVLSSLKLRWNRNYETKAWWLNGTLEVQGLQAGAWISVWVAGTLC